MGQSYNLKVPKNKTIKKEKRDAFTQKWNKPGWLMINSLENL